MRVRSPFRVVRSIPLTPGRSLLLCVRRRKRWAWIRRASRSVGLDPAGVQVLAELPALYLPPSNFVVTPVLAWWAQPSPISVVDHLEVARVIRAPLSELTDPARRFTVSHPSGFVGPAFDVDGLLVWGFTAGLLSKVLELAGLERSWDRSDHRPLPPQLVEVRDRFVSPPAGTHGVMP